MVRANEEKGPLDSHDVHLSLVHHCFPACTYHKVCAADVSLERVPHIHPKPPPPQRRRFQLHVSRVYCRISPLLLIAMPHVHLRQTLPLLLMQKDVQKRCLFSFVSGRVVTDNTRGRVLLDGYGGPPLLFTATQLIRSRFLFKLDESLTYSPGVLRFYHSNVVYRCFDCSSQACESIHEGSWRAGIWCHPTQIEDEASDCSSQVWCESIHEGSWRAGLVSAVLIIDSLRLMRQTPGVEMNHSDFV